MNRYMFVFLSGRDKGKTRIYPQGRVTIGTVEECDLYLSPEELEPASGDVPFPEVLATVRPAEDDGTILTIKFGDELPLSINGDLIMGASPGEVFRLNDGDTLGFGPSRDGVELMFHVLRKDFQGLQPVAVHPELSSSGDITGTVHPLTATLFVKELATSLWTEVPQRAKVYTLGTVFTLLGLGVLLVVLNFYQLRNNQQQVFELQKQIEQDRLEREAGRREVEEQQRRLDELQHLYEANAGFAQRVSEKYSGGVCLVVGVYSFVEKESGKPLRYETVDDANGPILGDSFELLASTDGLGPVVEVEFTGTGFLIAQGMVLTNSHVVYPWRKDEQAMLILNQGMRPRVERLRAYFPLLKTPFNLRVAKNSEADDIALCRFDQGDAAVPLLPIPSETISPPVPGKSIVLLGYPTGVDALVERLPELDRLEVLGRGNRSLIQIAQILADRGAIRPLTTQGIISDSSPGRIVHNAATAEGGSGGPMFDDSGTVIAVNSAILVDSETGKTFGGSNFAIPISRVFPMLENVQAKINE